MRPPYLTYRPLRAGIAIINRAVDQYGTLGFFGQSPDGAVWLVSCYHVLGRIDFSAFAPGETIFQPDYGTMPVAIAQMTAGWSAAALDCAAARMEAGIAVRNEVLGLGRINPAPAAPVIGMRVCKYGVATELTEGVITAVQENDVTIGLAAGFPEDYRLSATGDSGALWLEQGTMRPVALHKQGAPVGGDERAVGTAMDAVLAALHLTLL
jgi:hypothetical protein